MAFDKQPNPVQIQDFKVLNPPEDTKVTLTIKWVEDHQLWASPCEGGLYIKATPKEAQQLGREIGVEVVAMTSEEVAAWKEDAVKRQK